MATIVLTNESGTPSTPSAGITKVYARGGALYLLDSAGVSHPVNSPGITAGPTGSGATFTGNSAISEAIAQDKQLTKKLLAAAGVDYKPYIKFIGERPSAQRVAADRKADAERMAAEAKKA